MKKNIFAVLVFSAMVLFGSVVFAFDPSLIVSIDNYGNILPVDNSRESISTFAEESAVTDYFSDYRRFRGAGEWIVYIPFSFQVSWGMDGSVQFFEAVFVNFPDEGVTRWEQLTPGSTTPTWGGFYKIVSVRSDEDVLVYGQTPTFKTRESLSYLDLRDSEDNVALLSGEESNIKLPRETKKYYYNYGALFICAGQTISADFLKEKLGDSLVGVVICDKDGFLSKYYQIEKLAGYSFSGNGVPVMVFRKNK
jgi:hypothetical protein